MRFFAHNKKNTCINWKLVNLKKMFHKCDTGVTWELILHLFRLQYTVSQMKSYKYTTQVNQLNYSRLAWQPSLYSEQVKHDFSQFLISYNEKVLAIIRNQVMLTKEIARQSFLKIGCHNSESSHWEESNEKNPIKIGWKIKFWCGLKNHVFALLGPLYLINGKR